MTEDHEQESHHHILEGESHEEEDLTHAELGEAVAAALTNRTPAKTRQRRQKAPSPGAVGFLQLQMLPANKRAGNLPLAVWIVVQLTVIAASAGRWKLWASEGVGDSPSIELMTLSLLLVVQVSIGTLIYPILVDSWSKLLLAIATVVAFDAIGSLMIGGRSVSTLWAAGFVVAWIIGLAVWRAALPGPLATMVLRLLLTLLVIGWPIAIYLHAEFAPESSGGALASFGGPLAIGLRQLELPSIASQTLVTLGVFMLPGGVLSAVRRGQLAWRRRPRILPNL